MTGYGIAKAAKAAGLRYVQSGTCDADATPVFDVLTPDGLKLGTVERDTRVWRSYAWDGFTLWGFTGKTRNEAAAWLLQHAGLV